MLRRLLRHQRSSRFAIMLAAAAFAVAEESAAYAQSRSTDPPRVEFTLSPGGTILFAEERPEPEFANYWIGGGVTVNLTWLVAVEVEAGTSFGRSRELDFGVGRAVKRKTPNTLDYNANVVLSARTGSPVVPYITGGAGAFTLFSRQELDVDGTETYFAGNGGGGVKWLTSNERWGVRGDYRFLAVRSKSDAPAFFGRTNRYAHRLYGALIVNLDGDQ